jgi:hypothetical protein
MAKGAWTLSEYPLPLISISCSKCDRAGQYRRATLIDRFGPDVALPDLLHGLARCSRRDNWSDPYMVIYPDCVER